MFSLTTQRGKKERKKDALFFGTMKTPFYAWQRKISSNIYILEAS
jgi:hypothetical protein